jgi:uncharacterized membrane protein
MNSPWHLYVMAFLYIIAGFNHFRTPGVYLKIIPPYLPFPKTINILSGLLEIAFGIILLTSYKTYAAWGIIILLLGFYMTHYYMLTNKEAGLGLPKSILVLRMPLQLGLIYWAYQYTFEQY